MYRELSLGEEIYKKNWFARLRLRLTYLSVFLLEINAAIIGASFSLIKAEAAIVDPCW